MNYNYFITIKNNDTLQESFNKLIQETFFFDFTEWYAPDIGENNIFYM